MASILIVDDDPSIRAMFARALQALGDVDVAANGVEALRFLAGKKYGVLLIDLHMPVMDGFSLLQALAASPGPNRDAPVYVVTADASDQTRLRALRRHAVFFLSKPVPLATLTGLVDATLKKGAARAALPQGGEGPHDGAASGPKPRPPAEGPHDGAASGPKPRPPAEAPHDGAASGPKPRPPAEAPHDGAASGPKPRPPAEAPADAPHPSDQAPRKPRA